MKGGARIAVGLASSVAVHALVGLGVWALAAEDRADSGAVTERAAARRQEPLRVALFDAPSGSGPVGVAPPSTEPVRQTPRPPPRARMTRAGRRPVIASSAAAEPMMMVLPAVDSGDAQVAASPRSKVEVEDTEAARGVGATGSEDSGASGASGGDGHGHLEGTGTGPGGGASSGAVDLTGLQRALARSAERCYPQAARRFRLTGEAKVRFCVDEEGDVSALALKRSSGKPLLDDAALRCVVPGAAPLPAPADCYEVPMRFGPR